MGKSIHEIRDPLHVFVTLDSNERKLLDSRPFQRLRHIHQLAMTYLVYPGATHKRFEHSLGVMELASRVYDVVTRPENVYDPEVREIIPAQPFEYNYWRRVLRLAALCHDLGHLPFSHAAEHELLPTGWDHERITVAHVLNEELKQICSDIKVQPEDVAKLAVGAKKWAACGHQSDFTTWHAILSEIIVGNAFGVDRIDYLLRDAHHSGVAYGKFDHYRLIDTLRILPKSDEEREPALGILAGGIHTAESLLLARYFMYSQLYFHPVRRIYDIHLKDFLKAWLRGGFLPHDPDEHLKVTDNEVTAALLAAERDENSPGHEDARRIVRREHFHLLYARNPEDVQQNPEAAQALFEAAQAQFGAENVRFDHYREKNKEMFFPVRQGDGRITSSMSLSDVLSRVPPVVVDFVFVSASRLDDARTWLKKERANIINIP